MTTYQTPFRGDQVGSLLRPESIKMAREKFNAQELSTTELRKIEDEEIIRIIAKQKEAGIKSITDGEFRRSWWHIDFLENLVGVEGYTTDESLAFNGATPKPYNLRVIGEIDFPADHPFLADFKFLKEQVGHDAIAKQTIPSPNMLFRDIYFNPAIYKDFDDFADGLVKTYRKAIQFFYEAGCRYLQLDDTNWAALVFEKRRKELLAKGIDPDKLSKKCAWILQETLKNKPTDLTITMHICRGNFASTWIFEGDYAPVAKDLASLPLDGIFLEYDNERSGSLATLKEIYRPGTKIVLGLITTKTPILEDKELIKAKIQEATQYVPLEDLCLSPQCGFASTEEGNHLTEDEQWAKLKLVTEIAQEVWGEI